MKPKMWAYMIHLGSNMWYKKGMEVPWLGKLDDEQPIYHDYLNCDKKIWREITDFLPTCGINTLLIDMGEGVILDSHPELAIPGSWTKEEFREELARLRSIGLTPIPKFNFSAGHNAWLQDYAYMIGTDLHNQVCMDVIEETIELFDTPEFFHLGLEEEDPINQGGQPVSIMRAPNRKTSDALLLFDVCRKHGVRPWIWLDYKGVKEFGGEEAFRANIPHDVLISNFVYRMLWDHPEEFERKPDMQLYRQLDEWGYEQIPTVSTYESQLNPKQTMKLFKKYQNSDLVTGFMTASWGATVPKRYYYLLNDAFVFGNAKKDIFPECE